MNYKEVLNAYNILQGNLPLNIGHMVCPSRRYPDYYCGWMNTGCGPIGGIHAIKRMEGNKGILLSNGHYYPVFSINYDVVVGYPSDPSLLAYKICQRASGLKPGHRVEILSACGNYQHGWGTVWNDDMRRTIGHEFTIEAIREANGVVMEGMAYAFPFFCLRKI